MLKDDTDTQVVAERDGYALRQARGGDREAVADLCARAWPHGRDYVPAEWDKWLADREGIVLVADRRGDVAAVARVTFQSSHEAWLHGLRVHPDHRRQGLAHWILACCLDQARAHGASVARLATGSDNVAVQRTTAHQGMDCVAEFRRYRATPSPGAPIPPVLSSADLPRVWRLLHESPGLQAAHGLYETFWVWQELTVGRLAEALRAREVVGTADADGDLQAVAVVGSPAAAEPMIIRLLAGRAAEVTLLSAGLLALAAASGASEVEAKLPEAPQLRRAAEAAGFEPDQGMEVLVFEKGWGEWTSVPRAPAPGGIM